MSCYTKAQRERLDQVAIRERTLYRRCRRGTGNTDTITGTREAWWRKTPQRWAWLNEEPTEFLTLPQLKKAVKKEGICNIRVYNKERRKHSDWPSNPYVHYGDEWISWHDLFGRKSPKYLTLPQLKREVAKEEICIYAAYQKESPKHSDWPSAPNVHYGNEWILWRDLFGKKKYLTLAQLKKGVKKEGTSNAQIYKKERRKHSDWPSSPDTYYSEWVSWYDLFKRKEPKFLTFAQLRKVVKKAGISGTRAYWKESRKHSDWPSNPQAHYRDEWISWYDLFKRKEPKFLTLLQLKKAVKKAGISSEPAYRKERRKHSDWPSAPYIYYEEWISWPHLFGRKAA